MQGGDLDNAYWLFVQLFRKYFPDLMPNDAILDLGCGPAAIPLRLARLFRTCQVHCVDGAACMLAQGKQAVQGKEWKNRYFFSRVPCQINLHSHETVTRSLFPIVFCITLRIQ